MHKETPLRTYLSLYFSVPAKRQMRYRVQASGKFLGRTTTRCGVAHRQQMLTPFG
jgi:hypothetical protein